MYKTVVVSFQYTRPNTTTVSRYYSKGHSTVVSWHICLPMLVYLLVHQYLAFELLKVLLVKDRLCDLLFNHRTKKKSLLIFLASMKSERHRGRLRLLHVPPYLPAHLSVSSTSVHFSARAQFIFLSKFLFPTHIYQCCVIIFCLFVSLPAVCLYLATVPFSLLDCLPPLYCVSFCLQLSLLFLRPSLCLCHLSSLGSL